MSKTRKVKTPKEAPSAMRTDEWANAVTGLGIIGQDKRLGASFQNTVMPQEEAEILWRGDDICARIIETLPNEMLRAGHCPQVQGDKETTEEAENEADRLQFDEKLRLGLCFARAYGGGGLLLGVNNGRDDLSKPLDFTGEKSQIKSFDFITLLTPRELRPTKYFADPRQARYGEISEYRIEPIDTPPGAAPEQIPVHESRIIRFPGIETSRGSLLRNVNPGWGDSVLNRCASVVRDFQASWQGAGIILQDFAPGTLKMVNLAKILGTAGGPELVNRARGLQLARSIARTTIIDSTEEYKRESTNVSGMGELLEKLMLRLAAAADMPVSLLMGQAPAGLNATGDSDIRWFYDKVRAQQDRILLPILTKLYTLVFLAQNGPTGGKLPENWVVKFAPLWQLTDVEQATMRKTVADTDVAYMTAGVLTPQQVAMSRFGGDEYSPETQIDVDLIQDMLDDEDLQMKELGVGPEADAEAAAQAAAANPNATSAETNGAPEDA